MKQRTSSVYWNLSSCASVRRERERKREKERVRFLLLPITSCKHLLQKFTCTEKVNTTLIIWDYTFVFKF